MTKNKATLKTSNCISEDNLYSFIRGNLDLQTEREIIKHLSVCQDCLLEVRALIDLEDFFENKKGLRISDLEMEIFKEIKESPKEDEQTPTLWLMLNNAVMKEIKLRPGILWSWELSKPGVYCLIDKQNKVLWQEEISKDLVPGGHVRGRHSLIPGIEIKTMESGNEEDRKLTITIERKKQKLLLLLTAE
jgi:hypothetical protein